MESKIVIYDSDNKELLPNKNEEPPRKLLWVDISNFSELWQFLICSFVVFIFFIPYGYLQEAIFAINGFKPFGWYLTLVQFFYYSAFGFVESRFIHTQRRIPIVLYLLLGLILLGSMGFSNASLGYLNYPTQVIFKCCKLIPVMIGGILIQQKVYKIIDVIAASCMCAGLVLFTLADSKVSPHFNIIGIILISSALFCDALIGNFQEKMMKKHNASNAEIVLYSYFVGFIYLLLVLLVSGELIDGTTFCLQNPVTYAYIFLFSLSGFFGVQAVLSLIRTCGALVAVTVTTCRKALTIVISFLLFSKPFTFQYVWAGLLIVIGIYLNVLGKTNHIDLKTTLKNSRNILGNVRKRRKSPMVV
ncbi:adenosine 3'-phospho 5'-phosphosulfate transporter 2 [Sipha flava]|uniref:Adenosine 3'-phospho 5'-phosphosulfate transporter 2 n=2 Tax=Sipha flava TaxID=143950 RepID=A0A8B8FL02_9HEMI|nr:adenosine 3'-phospho 5'-phosphosulfate transporter 2 [Sipha flava]XP_025411328.1 adenosine 3'-phospho 5'-phosphosulfate transporter 2 [Sipha flava]